jgi:hypothetical protein
LVLTLEKSGRTRIVPTKRWGQLRRLKHFVLAIDSERLIYWLTFDFSFFISVKNLPKDFDVARTEIGFFAYYSPRRI